MIDGERRGLFGRAAFLRDAGRKALGLRFPEIEDAVNVPADRFPCLIFGISVGIQQSVIVGELMTDERQDRAACPFFKRKRIDVANFTGCCSEYCNLTPIRERHSGKE